MGTQSHTICLADFAFSDSDEITACPEGQKPQRIKTGKNGGKIVHFDKAVCDKCPRQSDCPVKRDKRHSTISYHAKALRLARRRAKEKTAAFREVYRFRAGAEGTMSDLNRITGIKHLRVSSDYGEYLRELSGAFIPVNCRIERFPRQAA